MRYAPKYAALRSYATRRRTHSRLGDMPDPVCTVGPSRMWLRTDIATWLIPFTRLDRR